MAGKGFLELPAEVRNQVYQLTKSGTEDCKDIYIHEWKHRDDFPYPLTRVNQQIRVEASMMFYKGVHLHFDIADEEAYQNCKEWIAIIHDMAIPAAASFEIKVAHPRCQCDSPCLLKATVEADTEDDSEDECRGREYEAFWAESKILVEVEVVRGKKKNSCWTVSKSRSLKTALEGMVKNVQPAGGMLKLPKASLEKMVDRVAGRKA